MTQTIIVAAIIVAILGLAILYVIRSKKKGGKCIGCPSSGGCPSAKYGGCTGNCSNKD